MKKITIKFFVVLIIILLLLFVGLFINFRTSYRYTVYQINLGLKHKDTAILKYYDVEKILTNDIHRKIQQSINLDRTLERAHNNQQDTYILKMFDEMKDTLIKQKRIYIENDIKFNSLNLDRVSDFQIFWCAFIEKSIIPDVTLEVEKTNKNKVEITSKKGEEYFSTVYEKIKNKWVLTDLY